MMFIGTAMFPAFFPAKIKRAEKHLYVIYQTPETVFHRDIETPRRELQRAEEYFCDEI